MVQEIFKHIKKVMRKDVPKVTKDKTIDQVIEILRRESKRFESIDYIYVVEKDNTLIGVFSVKELFRLPRTSKVERFMMKDVIKIYPSADYKLISRLTLRYGIKALPVVNKEKLVGVIPPREILQILNHVVRREIFNIAGIHKSHLEYEHAQQVPFYKSIIHRTPWLIVGLIGIMITATFIGAFEKVLEKHIILAFFMPAIVYISDALGTQIQTIFTRDLAVIGDRLNIKKYIIKEGFINLIISVIVSLLMFLAISSFWSGKNVAIAISSATFAALIFTSFTSFLITLAIEKFGGDPAIGSGPFATVISDATSIIIYFAIASVML